MQPTHWVTEGEGAGTSGPGAYVTEQQMKSYLNDFRSASPASPGNPSSPTKPASPVRSARFARPTGSRPPPAHFRTWANRESARVQDIPSFDALHAVKEGGGKTQDTPVHVVGKALVQPPQAQHAAAPDEPAEDSEVRAAMEKLGLDDEKLYVAARDEAAEIVWKHRNPNAPENNPSAPYAYAPPARKTLQRPKLQRTRSRSVGPRDDERADEKMRKRHSIGSSAGSRSSSLQDPPATTTSSPATSPLFSPPAARSAFDLEIEKPVSDLKVQKSPSDLKIAKAAADLPPQRKTSGSHRKPSGSLFQNPHDHIYEEPSDDDHDDQPAPAPAPTPRAAEPAPAPLPLGMRRNPFTRLQSVKSSTSPGTLRTTTPNMRRFDRYEIHRNEPTQSRNAGYTLNHPAAASSKPRDPSPADVENENAPAVRMKGGKEVRSDELRAATGFSLRNRSPKLPTPTVVSDAPGRPIVSFQRDYGVVELKEEKSIFPADSKAELGTEKGGEKGAEKQVAPPVLEKAVTDPVVPTRKSVFDRPATVLDRPATVLDRPATVLDRPTSRSSAAPSPFERPASRSASPFDRPPAGRSAASSPAPLKESGLKEFGLKEFGPTGSPATGNGGRPATPKGPFANRSPLGRFGSGTSAGVALRQSVSTLPKEEYALPEKSSTPLPADPYALPSKSSTPLSADPYALPSKSTPPLPAKSSTPPLPADPYALPSKSSTPPLPSKSSTPLPPDPYALPPQTSTRPASRTRFSRPQSISTIPTISVTVTETPTPRHARTASIPAIGVTPPVPSIAVSDAPATATAPPRGRFSRGATTQAVPSISVNEAPGMTRGHSFNAPVVNLPTIAVDEAVPSIIAPSVSVTPSVNDSPSRRNRPVPSINAPISVTPSINDSPSRPLPDPRNYSKKPTNTPSARSHWTPTSVRTGAQCTACALPISGRIVSAGGCRFHPECFACYQCGEKLECVAFYPEPSAKHAARCDRIHARSAGHALPPLPGWESPEAQRQLEDQDGTDPAPRFYCHLDFHECFSPRCKSCKTPIEGEVIVACGAEWHAGHFFCAQCGDPFDSATPFVEKDGYAWCVGCHTHRYSAKCRGCRKPVTDTVVKALGAEWHQRCFVCVECKGPFDDGRYFLRGESEDPVCVRCEERRLKA